MMVEPIWYQYATFGEDGLVNGISDDAPEEAKKAYEEYVERCKNGEKP